MKILRRLQRRRREVAFWGWFARNEPRLFEFERDQDRVFDDLMAALARVHRDLTFEFGPVTDGARELVVSAGGMRAAFPAVERLVAAAPSFPRWRITKFRGRLPVAGRIHLGDLRVDARDVWVTPRRDGARWRLTVHLPGYEPTPEHRYEQIGYLWLDHALGEYDVETKIGSIEFASSDRAASVDAVPLDRLPLLIDGALVS
jgi:hypothetical protein